MKPEEIAIKAIELAGRELIPVLVRALAGGKTEEEALEELDRHRQASKTMTPQHREIIDNARRRAGPRKPK